MMTVIEAIVVHLTGWREEQKEQYDEATCMLYAARSEINSRMFPVSQAKPVTWIPREAGDE